MDVSRHFLLQNIFRSYKEVLMQGSIPSNQLKAIDAVTACRSGKLGASYFQCERRHQVYEQRHSCRHRSCHICSRDANRRWIDDQKRRLLNCPHFHVVFTLPSEYRVLWRYNTRWFTRTMFQCVQQTLLTLMGDRKYHGVTPGILLALHTWGRQLNLHPHIHGVVTAGGLDGNRQWKDTGKYLLPIHVVKKLYRGKLQARLKEALAKGTLRLPPDMDKEEFRSLYRRAWKKQWSVRIEEQYSHGKGVVLYLSRYMKGGPIHPQQITHCDSQRIAFRYQDHRTGRQQSLALKPLEFLRRLLQHVPEDNVHTVRHYGLYGGAARRQRNHCRWLMGDLSHIEYRAAAMATAQCQPLRCGTCHGTLNVLWRRLVSNGRKGISHIRNSGAGFVQQVDEADNAAQLRKMGSHYAFS